MISRLFFSMLVTSLVVVSNPSLADAESKRLDQKSVSVSLDGVVKQLEDSGVVIVKEEDSTPLTDASDSALERKFDKQESQEMIQNLALGECANVCSNTNCNTYCSLMLAPGEPDIRTCGEYFLHFSNNPWNTTYGNQVCHLDDDVDFWSLEIDFEFYVSDHRVKKCHPTVTSDVKREVAQVSCSFFTGVFNQSKCAKRIENKFITLAGEGYFPHPNLMGSNGEPQNVCP